MDLWILLWLVLVVLIIGGFILILRNFRIASGLENALAESIRQAGWKIHGSQINGSSSDGIDWQMDVCGKGINPTLYWYSETVHLRKGALAIVPRAVGDMFRAESRSLTFRLVNSGKNWLKEGLKTLQHAAVNGQEIFAGTPEFQERFLVFSTNINLAQILIMPELENLLLHFPNRVGQPPAPVYVFISKTNVQVYVESPGSNMDQLSRLETIGTTIARNVRAFPE